MNNTERLITIKEATEILNVKESRLRTAIFKKEIGYIKLKGLVRFKGHHLSQWINSNEVRPLKS
jgi:excisionase family DNA binding protein